ncbi:MAG TPA: hypothetical protein DDZ36_12470 [Deltaproteobacteria bacterium]|nr:hypothetical protein [Deltaproteobacteria bacterium]
MISEWDNAQAQRPPKVAASAIVDWCTGEAEIVVRFPDYALRRIVDTFYFRASWNWIPLSTDYFKTEAITEFHSQSIVKGEIHVLD